MVSIDNNKEQEKKEPRRVRFAEFAELYHMQDDVDDADRIWYTDNDYREFDYNRKDDTRAFRRGRNRPQHVDVTVHCSWGIESRSNQRTYRELMRRRSEVTHAVLNEQYQQYESGDFCADRIAELAANSTLVAAMEALERGVRYGMENARDSPFSSLNLEDSPLAKKHKRSFSVELESEWETSDELQETDVLSPRPASRKQQKPALAPWQQFLLEIFLPQPSAITL